MCCICILLLLYSKPSSLFSTVHYSAYLYFLNCCFFLIIFILFFKISSFFGLIFTWLFFPLLAFKFRQLYVKYVYLSPVLSPFLFPSFPIYIFSFLIFSCMNALICQVAVFFCSPQRRATPLTLNYS